jgi:hypothetical protein
VWTGTTYALAAGMILEAFSVPSSMTSSSTINDVTLTISEALEGTNKMTPSTILINGIQGPGSSSDIISAAIGCESRNNLDSVPLVSQQELLKMAFTTAQGIHDAVSTYRTCIGRALSSLYLNLSWIFAFELIFISFFTVLYWEI